ncbi:T9SS type A sorting domain-containing protein [Phaeodactylibacter xiamenensis]|uniref:T9SS type A sorting domain-containing protein n=1 Tax=Phaeodactylibacter xiamenensis TaxID=1524460 RepID=UPI003CCBD8D6
MGNASVFKTPGGKPLNNIPQEFDGAQTVYDSPLGIFNILNTPKIQTYTGIQSGDEVAMYKLKNGYDPEYVFNQSAGFSLSPEDVRFQLIFDECTIDAPNTAGIYPTAHPGRYATPLMPIACLSDYTVNFVLSQSEPPFTINWCSSRPRLKVVAALNNTYSPSVTNYAASYEVTFELVTTPLPHNPYLGIPETATIDYETFDPREDLEAWGEVIIKDIPVTILIDPENPNIQTLLDVETINTELGIVEIFPGDKDQVYNVILEGIPPCSYTEPASEGQVSYFCENVYDPSINLMDENSPFFLQSSPSRQSQYMEPYVKVFPQPASGFVHVKLPREKGDGQLRLSDISGRNVLIQDFRSNQVDLNLSSLPSGLYILNISWLEGYPPYVMRLVKH